jgi:SAM-dependent methyltransferase
MLARIIGADTVSTYLRGIDQMSRQVLDEERCETTKATSGMPTSPGVCPLCGSSGIVPFMTAPDRFHLRRELYHLLRCSACSGVWLNCPPRPDQMGVHYDEDYHRAIMTAGETYPEKRWKRHRELIARHKQGGAILDIGCSSGAFLSAMKGPNWKLYGIEMEASTAEKARSASGAEVFVGDVDDAPFAQGSFDVITAFDLLEHVYHPRQFLGNVLRWLKPGGIFFTMLPNIDSWESRLFGSYWYGLELPRHLFHFSPRSLRHVLLDLGFEEVSLSTSEVTYVERSVGYLCIEALERGGFSPAPAAKVRPGNIAWRALRKALRLALVNPMGHLASVAGAGPNIEGIFRKPASPGKRIPEHEGAREMARAL